MLWIGLDCELFNLWNHKTHAPEWGVFVFNNKLFDDDVQIIRFTLKI